MELDYALLCDAAQVSQGKTFILGGGITILWRSQFPAALGISLALQLTYHRTEAQSEHKLQFKVIDADGKDVIPELGADVHIGEPSPGAPPTLPLAAPIALQFPPQTALEGPGLYSVEILLDGRHVKSLPFSVSEPPSDDLAQAG